MSETWAEEYTREDTEFTERPSIPEDVTKRPPTLSQQVIERFGFPDNWEVVAWEKKRPNHNYSDFGYMEIKGGVYNTYIKKGPRKGQTNFKKPEPATEATVTLLRSELEEWRKRWERETGYCAECWGTGFRVHSVSIHTGTKYRHCKHCSATGRS